MKALALFFLLTFNAFAELNNAEKESILNVINEIKSEIFPELNSPKVKFSIYSIKSDEYFFVSNFKISRVFGKENYRIGVSPIIFDHKIPSDALKAILVHEMQHTFDYHHRGILPIGIQLIFRKHKYRYERRTDLQTVLHGFGPGLANYRRWQYQLLDDRALEIKKKNYLTDEEIDFIVSNLEIKKERIKSALRGYMPKNIDEWISYLHQSNPPSND